LRAAEKKDDTDERISRWAKNWWDLGPMVMVMMVLKRDLGVRGLCVLVCIYIYIWGDDGLKEGRAGREGGQRLRYEKLEK
jgi:hypothetical protein